MEKTIKVPLIIVLILIGLFLLFRLSMPYVAVKLATTKLPEIIHAPVTVDSLSLGLLRGYVEINDFRIAQPEGFGPGNLLVVPVLKVKVRPGSILSGPLTVEEIVLIDWEVNLVKNRDGLMNIDVLQGHEVPLQPGLTPPPGGSNQVVEAQLESSGKYPSPKISSSPPTNPGQPILVQSLKINNLSCSYTDYALTHQQEQSRPDEELADFSSSTDPELTEPSLQLARTPEIFPEAALADFSGEEDFSSVNKPLDQFEDIHLPLEVEKEDLTGEKALPESAEEEALRIQISGFNLSLQDLLIDPGADPTLVEPASVLITARIIQEPFVAGFLGIDARVGPIGEGIPPMNLVLRLADLELEPLDLVVPDGVAQVLGGSALDLAADLALAEYLLDCELEVESAGGNKFPLFIGGTPEQPEVDRSAILFGVMAHLGGGVGNLVGNIGGAGYQIGAAAAETTWEVGKGAVNVVGSIGGGLFKTVTSAATGDLSGAGEGLSDATVGTVNEAATAAGAVAGEVSEGASATADSTVGADADREWRASTKIRWEHDWSMARKLLDEMPYPPPVRDQEDHENVGSNQPAVSPAFSRDNSEPPALPRPTEITNPGLD